MKSGLGKFFAFLLCLTFLLPIVSGNTSVFQYEELPVSQSVTSESLQFTTYERNMNVTTFVSPDGSKEQLWHFLNAAEESIYVEIYGINNPRILDLIHQLHDDKPSLEMKFLLGWNSLGYYSQNDYVANNLTELGYEVRWTSADNFTYAHQKFFIIDNVTTVLHAGNWAKTSFPEPNGKANREWSIAMTDSVVTDSFRNVFDMDWRNGTPYDAGTHGTGTALTYTYSTSTYQEPFATAGEFSGDMKVTPIFSPDTSLEGILYCINSAEYTLDIQIPYFTSVGDDGSVDDIIDAILAAKARGVTVRVISEEEKDWVQIEDILIEHGIPIVWQDTRWFTANHNKGIIVDGKIVLISSINYSDNSIENNREAGVIIEHEGIAQWYRDVFDFDWGMGDFDAMDEVNIDWSPKMPEKNDVINVTVFAHMLNSSWLEEIRLRVKIGDGSWTNHTITDNLFLSVEDDYENYFYEIPAQPAGTNITVQAHIYNDTVWYDGLNMTIHVLPSGLVLNELDDVAYEYGSSGNSLTWDVSSDSPDYFAIWKDDVIADSGNWNGSSLSTSVDGLPVGITNYTLWVNDTAGEIKSDVVLISVEDTTNPSISEPADMTIEETSTGNLISWTVEELSYNEYEVLRNGTSVETGNITSTLFTLEYVVDGLPLGEYNFTIVADDEYGNNASDEVIVTVYDGISPNLTSPSDIAVDIDTTGNVLSWTAIDLHPDSYVITLNGDPYETGDWTSGVPITVNLDNLAAGTYTFVIAVTDESGNTASDEVIVTVPLSNTEMLIAAGIGIAAIVIIGIGCISKRK